MRTWIARLAFVATILGATGEPTSGQDVGAVASGYWNVGSTWTTGTPPGSSNNVYIGSTYPGGSAASATVTLTQAQSANNLYLGNGGGTSGTLDLSGNALTIYSLIIGQNGGTGTLTEGGGSFTAQYSVDIESGNSLTFGANDTTSILNLSGGSSATTAATGNVTSGANVYTGSTLTLGADMNLGTGSLNVQDAGSTFNMNGHSLSAGTAFLGWNGSAAVSLLNPGSLTINQLFFGNGMTFNINSNDTINQFNLAGASSSTLNNSVGSLNLYNGSTAVTTSAGGVDSGVSIQSGSTLTLGANLKLTGDINLQDSGSTLNMAGYSLSAPGFTLGSNGSSAVTLLNPGSLTINQFTVGNGMTFNINANDTINQFNLVGGASSTLNNSVGSLNLYNGSTAVTTSTGTVNGGANIESGSTLTLGANLNLGTGTLNVQDSGSTFNAQHYAVTSNTLFAGWYGAAPVSLTNLGQVTVNDLYAGNGTALTLHGGDVVNGLINLQGGSVLTVQQVNGIGLTLNGTSLNSLTIDPSSMDLIFNVNTGSTWDFRWLDPNGSNWVSTIDGMIASGQIEISAPNGYAVVDSGGYTYIDGFASTSVPEPSSLVLACLATAGVAIGMRTRDKRRGRRGGR